MASAPITDRWVTLQSRSATPMDPDDPQLLPPPDTVVLRKVALVAVAPGEDLSGTLVHLSTDHVCVPDYQPLAHKGIGIGTASGFGKWRPDDSSTATVSCRRIRIGLQSGSMDYVRYE